MQTAWSEVEVAGDLGALEGALHEDFLAVGPLGFVLSTEAWLDRHRSGALQREALRLDEPAVRVFGGDAAPVQRVTYHGAPDAGRFRATHGLVREGGRWRIAGLQLSAIGGPPAQA